MGAFLSSKDVLAYHGFWILLVTNPNTDGPVVQKLRGFARQHSAKRFSLNVFR
jgi:hypothetical protein